MPDQRQFTAPTFAVETPHDSNPWQRAELYLPQGVMRVVNLVGDLVTRRTVVDLRDLAFKPTRQLYQEEKFQKGVALGRELFAEGFTADEVDLSQIPAGYPELQAFAVEARTRPSVMLPDLVPGQHYLYVNTIGRISEDPEQQRRTYTVFQFESFMLEDFGLKQIFGVYRRHDPQLDKRGHVLLFPESGWEPYAPVNLTHDQTEAGWRLVTWMRKEPDMHRDNQFHEVTSDEVALIAALHAPIKMNPYILPSSGSDPA